MSFRLEFSTDNAAFTDGAGPSECARILRYVANQIEGGREYGMVMDVNGNRIGEWVVELPEPEEEDESDER